MPFLKSLLFGIHPNCLFLFLPLQTTLAIQRGNLWDLCLSLACKQNLGRLRAPLLFCKNHRYGFCQVSPWSHTEPQKACLLPQREEPCVGWTWPLCAQGAVRNPSLSSCCSSFCFSPPSESRGSLAGIPFHCSLTVFAGDVAAPVILAVAALHHALGVRIVASTAAHQATAVAATRCLVTIPEEKIKQKQWLKSVGFGDRE